MPRRGLALLPGRALCPPRTTRRCACHARVQKVTSGFLLAVQGPGAAAGAGRQCGVRLARPVAARAMLDYKRHRRVWCVPCRGLALLPGLGVVSASHDQSLRVWTMQGECVAQLAGHSAIVYAAAALAERTLVASGAEDNTARLWRPDGGALQAIEHPGAFDDSPLETQVQMDGLTCWYLSSA